MLLDTLVYFGAELRFELGRLESWVYSYDLVSIFVLANPTTQSDHYIKN